MTVVVCGLGGEAGRWELPASVPTGRAWIHGGERTLYELAIAMAANGHDVELRGEVQRTEFDAMCRAAGATPRTGMGPRLPREDDVVVLPEGYPDPVCYARVALSPARGVVMMLGPFGLVGWPFVAGWTPPDVLEVSPDAVARPEHFQAVVAAGFEVWVHSQGSLRAATAAGVEAVNVGVGLPGGFPDPPTVKRFDVVAIGDNRWAPLARRVLSELSGPHRVLPRLPRDQLMAAVGEGRVLVWPSRIEGRSRIQAEARAMGTVPVALSTNPFAEGMDEEHGAFLVSSVEEMPAAVEALLADPERLAELAGRGIRSAREDVDWERYRARLDAALNRPVPRAPAKDALAAFGEALRGPQEPHEEPPEAREPQETPASGPQEIPAAPEPEPTGARIQALETDLAEARAALASARASLEASQTERNSLTERRSVRVALRVAEWTRPYFVWRERRAGRAGAPPGGNGRGGNGE